ncbi:MAG: serine/threonine-protein kinase, partial [Gammaproteobacteria bacterium]
MSNDKNSETLIPRTAPPESELLQLAELAFASRRIHKDETQAPRNLVFLSPEALDMDLSDPMQRNFGDYELLEKIGRGGMGLVYRARQRSLDREVALKLLIAGPWAPTRFIERFQSEAQSAARLEHPNIVTVYESGSAHDLNYFSMRLVRGESLATRLGRQGPLPPREAARILLIVAEAVDYAHRLGVLHLDLKPGNVLIDESGQPLVADFGLARRVDQALADMSGDTSGTPSYMAPEQVSASNRLIGRATDIYGLGSVLYELVTGLPPFSGTSAQATLEQVVNQKVVPPREREPRLPADLEAICLKCLRKDPKDRYATAAELADDLRSFLDDRPVSVRRPSVTERIRHWVRREPRLAVAVTAVAIALVAGLAATSQQWQRAEGNAQAARELIWENRREAAIALEQDGRGLEAIARLLANVRELEAAGAAQQAEIDRLRIGLLQTQGAQLIDSIVVADTLSVPFATALSRDGSRLALAFDDLSVRWYDTATLEERGRVSLAPHLAPQQRGDPWRTSDGRPRRPMLLRFNDNDRLLMTLEWIGNFVRPSESDSWLIDLPSLTVIEPPRGFTVAAFGPQGETALLRTPAGAVQLWQVEPWLPLAEPIPGSAQRYSWRLTANAEMAFSLGDEMRGLTIHDPRGELPERQVAVPDPNSILAWALSADSRHLAFGDVEGRVYLLDTASRAVNQLPAQRTREITWLSFSEDDEWLAVASFDGLAQIFDVASRDFVVSGEIRAEFPIYRVAVSRAQRLLIAAGQRDTALWRIPIPLFRLRAAGRIGVAPAALRERAAWYPLAWSLEQGLFASAGRDRQVRLWRLPASATVNPTGPRQLPDANRFDAARLIDVQWNNVRLVSPKGRPMTRWLELPQPPGYAEIIDQGRLLLLSVGAELRAYDTTTLNPRYAPVPLPQTPQRFLTHDDGRQVLLSFGGHGRNGHQEMLQHFDGIAGRRLPGEAVLDGPMLRYAFSPDGRRLAAVGARDGITSVFDSEELRPVAEFPHDPFEPVVWAEFHDEDLLLLVRPVDPQLGDAGLIVWNPDTDVIAAEIPLGAADPTSFIVNDAGIIVAGNEYDAEISFDGATQRLPRIAVTTSDLDYPFMALSPDGRLLARAYRNEIQLHDAATGALLGQPMTTDLPEYGALVSLGYTADGSALRAISMGTSQLHWRITPETGQVAALEAALGRLLPD